MVSSRPGKRNLDDITQFEVSGSSGDVIFSEGDAGIAMYLIQEGAIELLKTHEGQERHVTRLESGDFFGELSLLSTVPHGVSARAIGDYKLLRIDRDTLDQIVDEKPEVAIRMLRSLSARLRTRQEEALKHAGADEAEPEDPAGEPPTATNGAAGEADEGPPVDDDAVATKADQAAPGAATAAAAGKADEAPRPSSEDEPEVTESSRAALIHTESDTMFELPEGSELVVGRTDQVSGIVVDVDLSGVDAQRTLSRRHAKIFRRPDGFYVQEEEGVGNGTFVNGEKIECGVPVKLEPGDEVRFGFVQTVFAPE